MILCEKCQNFDFDGGCWSPSVVDVFGNFYRKYKCKYHKKITYKKMLMQTKEQLRVLIWLGKKSRSPYPVGRNRHIIDKRKQYFEYRDFLFESFIDMEWYQRYIDNIPAKDFKKHFKFETKQ